MTACFWSGSTSANTSSIGAQRVGLRLERGRIDPDLLEHRAIAERDRAPLDRPAHSLAGMRGEVFRRWQGDLAVGNRAMLEQVGVDPSALEAQADTLRAKGQGVLFVAIDGQLAGIVAVTDPIKDSAAEAIAALRRAGVHVVMLTGDNRRTADAVAQAIGGIDEVFADVLPDQKQAVIARLRGEGRIVAMAGDGINDAPALAAADVGIARGTGTDVAMESEAVTLVKGDLGGIVRARRLSQAVMRNIARICSSALSSTRPGCRSPPAFSTLRSGCC